LWAEAILRNQRFNKGKANMKRKHQIELNPQGIGRRGFSTQTAVASLALAVGAFIGFGGVTLAEHTGKGHVKVTQLSQRNIIEKLDGKAASATVSEVTFEPGQEDLSHRHAGPVFGYVLDGEYEHAINDEPARTYKAGETFYEPSGSLHRVARNPNGKSKTRLLAVILHSRDAKEVTIPHKGKE
jgi:quercetin dioxygenase-like cupin family protein